MNRIFLGKPLHWALLIILVALGWVTGAYKSHVIHFNTFVIGAIVVTIGIVFAVLKTSAPDEQVTRDPIVLDDE
ncbi:MAG: hypothetical protein ACRBC3_03955 [Burkholderiaceae bacterium]